MRDWLAVIRREYLESFVKAGGSVVRVAVADGPTRARLRGQLVGDSLKLGYLPVAVNSDTCRVHLIHDLVHHVNRQIDWYALADSVARDALRPYAIGEGTFPSIEAIAQANDDIAPELVRRRLQKYLTAEVYRDKTLSREFRLAMMQFVASVADGDGASSAVSESIRQWLTGELPRIGALKDLLIFESINRTNARNIFGSLGSWAVKAGRAGLVLVVDLARYTDVGQQAIGTLRYTPARALDVYEVVREFIDGADELVATLILFMVDRQFLIDDRRGVAAYNALYLRLVEDVHDERKPNPLAPMVRILP